MREKEREKEREKIREREGRVEGGERKEYSKKNKILAL